MFRNEIAKDGKDGYDKAMEILNILALKMLHKNLPATYLGQSVVEIGRALASDPEMFCLMNLLPV